MVKIINISANVQIHTGHSNTVGVEANTSFNRCRVQDKKTNANKRMNTFNISSGDQEISKRGQIPTWTVRTKL